MNDRSDADHHEMARNSGTTAISDTPNAANPVAHNAGVLAVRGHQIDDVGPAEEMPNADLAQKSKSAVSSNFNIPSEHALPKVATEALASNLNVSSYHYQFLPNVTDDARQFPAAEDHSLSIAVSSEQIMSNMVIESAAAAHHNENLSGVMTADPDAVGPDAIAHSMPNTELTHEQALPNATDAARQFPAAEDYSLTALVN